MILPLILCNSLLWCAALCFGVWHCALVCGTVLWCVALCFGVWYCVLVCGTVLWCVALCYVLSWPMARSAGWFPLGL